MKKNEAFKLTVPGGHLVRCPACGRHTLLISAPALGPVRARCIGQPPCAAAELAKHFPNARSVDNRIIEIENGAFRQAVLGQAVEAERAQLEKAAQAEPKKAEKKGRRSKADRLVNYTRSAFTLFTDEAGQPHLGDNSGLAVRLRSRAARELLADLFFSREERGISASAISEALPTIAAFCRRGGRRPVAVRVARLDSCVYIDLGDWPPHVVEVGPDGWRVIGASEAPVRFVRPDGTLPLPEPVRGGDWNALRELIRTDEQGFVLTVAWLLGALSGRGPYPILALFGPQGAGKSTTARMLAGLVDPRKASLGAQPREVRDLMIAAGNAHVLAYDNLSTIPGWLSDALCRLATGAGFRTRALYEDAEEALFEASRPIIINGIVDLVRQGDLADRTLAVRLDLMPATERKPEAELWAAYEKARPRILGLLLDALAVGLAREREIAGPLPRLADFARLVLAATPALPFAAETFLEAYGAAQAELQVAVLDDPFAQALLEHLEQAEAFEGTAAELLERLSEGRDRLPTGWPKTPRGVSAEIARLEPVLVGLGYTIKRTKDAHTRRRIFRIQKVAKQSFERFERFENGLSGTVSGDFQSKDSARDGAGSFENFDNASTRKPAKSEDSRGFEAPSKDSKLSKDSLPPFWNEAVNDAADRTETKEGDDGWFDPFEDDEDDAPF